MNIFNSFRRVFGRNRALARSGHMVRNKLCWDANNAVGLSKQRKIELDGLLFGFLYFGSPTALFASQHNFCGTIGPDRAKGLFAENRQVCSRIPPSKMGFGLIHAYSSTDLSSCDGIPRLQNCLCFTQTPRAVLYQEQGGKLRVLGFAYRH